MVSQKSRKDSVWSHCQCAWQCDKHISGSLMGMKARYKFVGRETCRWKNDNYLHTKALWEGFQWRRTKKIQLLEGSLWEEEELYLSYKKAKEEKMGADAEGACLTLVGEHVFMKWDQLRLRAWRWVRLPILKLSCTWRVLNSTHAYIPPSETLI